MSEALLLAMTTTTALALGITVDGKWVGERPKKMLMTRTLTSRPIGNDSLSPHTPPYTEMESDSETKTIFEASVAALESPPNFKEKP